MARLVLCNSWPNLERVSYDKIQTRLNALVLSVHSGKQLINLIITSRLITRSGMPQCRQGAAKGVPHRVESIASSCLATIFSLFSLSLSLSLSRTRVKPYFLAHVLFLSLSLSFSLLFMILCNYVPLVPSSLSTNSSKHVTLFVCRYLLYSLLRSRYVFFSCCIVNDLITLRLVTFH